jgi:hypothetical protein
LRFCQLMALGQDPRARQISGVSSYSRRLESHPGAWISPGFLTASCRRERLGTIHVTASPSESSYWNGEAEPLSLPMAAWSREGGLHEFLAFQGFRVVVGSRSNFRSSGFGECGPPASSQAPPTSPRRLRSFDLDHRPQWQVLRYVPHWCCRLSVVKDRPRSLHTDRAASPLSRNRNRSSCPSLRDTRNRRAIRWSWAKGGLCRQKLEVQFEVEYVVNPIASVDQADMISDDDVAVPRRRRSKTQV